MAQERDQVTSEPASVEDARPASAETERIHSHIEGTGGVSPAIGGTQARLNPGRVATEAADTVTDATAGRMNRLVQRVNSALKGVSGGAVDTDRAVAAVARHPVPAVILGVAATAIVARTLSRSRSGSATFRADRDKHSIGRQLILGTCAGVACWSAWRRTRKAGTS